MHYLRRRLLVVGMYTGELAPVLLLVGRTEITNKMLFLPLILRTPRLERWLQTPLRCFWFVHTIRLRLRLRWRYTLDMPVSFSVKFYIKGKKMTTAVGFQVDAWLNNGPFRASSVLASFSKAARTQQIASVLARTSVQHSTYIGTAYIQRTEVGRLPVGWSWLGWRPLPVLAWLRLDACQVWKHQ